MVLADGWSADEDTARAILEYSRGHLAPYLKVRLAGRVAATRDDAHRAGEMIATEYRYEDVVDRRP